MISRHFLLLCLLGVLLTLVTPTAWAVPLDDVIRSLEAPFQETTAAARRIDDYAADFSQESKIASLDRLQQAHGQVMVAFDYASGPMVPTIKFRWQYEQPTSQEIVTDGKTMWVYLPDNQQVIQSDLAKVYQSGQNNPMSFLTGLGNLSRDFVISWGTPRQDAEGNFILGLSPRQASSLINKLVIVVNRLAVDADARSTVTSDPPQADQPEPVKEGTPPAIRFPILSTAIYDANGNRTQITFVNVRINIGVAEKTFDFTPPPGVEVIRPTQQELGF
ncbi:MAG: outer membrane lipoprotein carrier protein LolA [Desulfuromonadales bacterium]